MENEIVSLFFKKNDNKIGMIMKQKVNDWLLRLIRADSCGSKTTSHICLYDMFRTQVMELAKEYSKDFTIVRVFKFEDIF